MRTVEEIYDEYIKSKHLINANDKDKKFIVNMMNIARAEPIAQLNAKRLSIIGFSAKLFTVGFGCGFLIAWIIC